MCDILSLAPTEVGFAGITTVMFFPASEALFLPPSSLASPSSPLLPLTFL